jgi:hypothetical protein
MEVSEYVGIIDLWIFRIAKPVPRVRNANVVALVAVGSLFGLRRRRKGHACALSAVAGNGKGKNGL